MDIQRSLPAALLVLALAACGQKDTAKGASAPARNWNAADACSLVSKADVAAAAGSEVSAAKLDLMSPGGDGMATASACRYTLANGATISLLARKSPTPDTSTAAIEAARTMGGTMPPATDVPGLGRAALWSQDMNSLQVFIDDQRYVTLSMSQAPGDPLPALTAIGKKAF
jgi:hypothetical protein